MTENEKQIHFIEEEIDTILIKEGEHFNTTKAITSPIWQTSIYTHPNMDEYLLNSEGTAPMHHYGRYGHPTNSAAQSIIAKLEGTESAVLCASGMAAISSAILAVVKSGEHIVTQKQLYGGAKSFFDHTIPNLGIEVTFVDQRHTHEFEKAIRPNTKLLYLETPSNPLLNITDLKKITALAKSKSITTIIDNTVATPYNQRPTLFGVDMVVHSASKSLSGHSDIIAGVVCGSHHHVRNAWKNIISFGSSISPMDSWLLLRGLRTFSLRVKRLNENAQRFAEYIQTEECVEKVFYPGLPSHPEYELAKSQMTGFGSLVSFTLKGQDEQEKIDFAKRIITKVKIPRLAPSLGAVESLINLPGITWGKTYSKSDLDSIGMQPSLVRISVGIENANDIIEDMKQALR